MLTKEDIQEYKEIYFRVYGEVINDEEAKEQGERLINFFKVIVSVSK